MKTPEELWKEWWYANEGKSVFRREAFLGGLAAGEQLGIAKGLAIAAEIADANHIRMSVRRYCADTDIHEYGCNVSDAIRAKAEEVKR